MKKYFIALIFASINLLAFSQEFSTPKSNVTVGDLLENAKNTPRSDTYYLIALSAARKNDIEIANKAIATGLGINPQNYKLLNLKGALLVKQGQLISARQTFYSVLKIRPEDEYANNCLKIIEETLQSRQAVNPILNNKSSYKGKTDAPIAPIEERPVSKEKLLTATYFEELKHKQECSHGMSLIKRAQENLIDKNPKSKDTFSLTKLVMEGLLTAAPVCPKSGFYSWKNNDVFCSEHGSFTSLDAEVTNVFKEYNTGLKAKLSRNYMEALKSFEQVVILYPLWAEAHFPLKTCLKYNPDNLDAQLLLANLYFRKGQKQAALNILDKISESQKGSVYGLSARSVAKSIRSGRSYYEIFPPY